jgi:succinate-semialdehyde dehydrogenase / glutarate-semialdehyde dehydrogenase
LIPQPSVRLVTFTGSIPVGKKLAEMAGRHMKPAIRRTRWDRSPTTGG